MASLKGRLIIAASIWIVLGLVAAGFALSAVFRQLVATQFQEELFVHLDELQRLAQFPAEGKSYLQRDLSDPRYEVPLSGYYWEILRDTQILARSRSLADKALSRLPHPPVDTGVHTHRTEGPTGQMVIAERVVANLPDGPPIRFLIGTDQRHMDAVFANFHETLTWSLSIFGISVVAAAALLIAFAMMPFQTLRDALSRVRAGEAKQVEGEFPSEVQPLVADLNTLLRSTSELIQRARAQAGNLAHGLKTPLAILTDEAYRLQESGSGEASETILSECKKMQTQIDYQVTRARAVAMRSSPGIVADVGAAAREVTAAFTRLYKDSRITVEADVAEGMKVSCDPQDLNEMLANLVDNACKFAHSEVIIHANAAKSGQSVDIIVDDDGPGLPVEARRVVFNIGERWDTRVPGSGLGLAIVKDLAELYGGNVSLAVSGSGGLSVVLSLPRAEI